MPHLYSLDGNKFSDKGFIRRLTKSRFAGYYSRYPLARARELKKRKRARNGKKARIMRIYRAWEVDRAQFRFLRIPSNFPRYARTRFGCSRRRSRSPCPREKHSTSPLEQQWRSTAHAGGEFIENNFPRRARSFACSLSDHTRTRRYERVRTHTDA